jgi:outer membrane lipoprotein-sorting protein
MKRLIALALRTLPVLLLLLVSGAAWPAQAEDTDPREIARKARANNLLDGSEGLTTLTIANKKGETRVRKMAMVSKLFDGGKTEKRLIRFVEPADIKGTAMLTFDHDQKDDDIWLYLPRNHKTRRIVASEKAKNFMGSEFTYADMTPPDVDDFTYRLLPSVKVDGVDCYVVESTPKDDDIEEENGFSKRVGYIGKRDYVIRKSVYFDLDGEEWKTLTASEVKEVDQAKHRFRAHQMVMTNRQNGRVSTLKLDQLQLRTEIPDEYFTTRFLERE